MPGDTMIVDGEVTTRSPRLDFNRDALASPGGQTTAQSDDPQPSVSIATPVSPAALPGMPTMEPVDDGGQQQHREPQSDLAASAAAQRQFEEQAAALRSTQARLATLESQQVQQRQQRAQSYQAEVTGHRDRASGDAERQWSQVEAAREAGDTKAERLALTNYQRSVARHDQAAGELDRLARGGQVPGAEAPQAQQFHPNVQAWIDSHPRYHSDKAYQAAAQAAAYEAERLDIQPGDPRYVEHVNAALKARGFDGDGQQQNGGNKVNGNGARPSGGGGAPPAGRGTGGGQQARVVTTPLGKFTFRDGRDQSGKPHRFINFPDKQTAEDFTEWATVNKMTPEEYANEFIKIAAERAEGADIGLQIGNEVVLR
jgi:hypothetical protein